MYGTARRAQLDTSPVTSCSRLVLHWLLSPSSSALSDQMCTGLHGGVQGRRSPTLLCLPADLGVVVDASSFFTVNNLQLGVTRPRGAYDGTWGVWLKNAADVLVTRFNISAVFTQDISVQAVQVSTVISNGIGRNLSVNPLYAGPYGILVSNVDFGAANVPYGLSGALPKVSSFFTFWNVKVREPRGPLQSHRQCTMLSQCLLPQQSRLM